MGPPDNRALKNKRDFACVLLKLFPHRSSAAAQFAAQGRNFNMNETVNEAQERARRESTQGMGPANTTGWESPAVTAYVVQRDIEDKKTKP
jgi:hypothetical protein